MAVHAPTNEADRPCDNVPMPIVTLNRATLVVGIVAGILLQQPLLTTVLFLILLPSVLGGQRWSLIAAVGRKLFARQIPHAEREDRRLIRFNTMIAFALLGLAQVAFVIGLPAVGWALALMVAAAASVALAGFCVGCFLYYQLRLNRYRFFRR